MSTLETKLFNPAEAEQGKTEAKKPERPEAKGNVQELAMATELERKSPEGYTGKVSKMAASTWEKIKHTPGLNFGAGIAQGIYEDVEGVVHIANTARKASGLTFGEGSMERAKASRQEFKAMGMAIGRMVRHPVDTVSALAAEHKQVYQQSIDKNAGSNLGHLAGKDFYQVASMFIGVGEVSAAVKGIRAGATLSKEASVAAKIASGAEKITEAAGTTLKREVAVAGKAEKLAVKEAEKVAVAETNTAIKAESAAAKIEHVAVKEAGEAKTAMPEFKVGQIELNKAHSKLGLDAETQAKMLVEAPEQRRNLLERSFGNIRESVRAFVENYTEKGVFNEKAFQREQVSIANKVYGEIAPQFTGQLNEIKAKYGLELNLDDLLKSEDALSPSHQIDQLEEQLQDAINRYVEKEATESLASRGSYNGIEAISEKDLQDYGKASNYEDALYRIKSQRKQDVAAEADLESFRKAFFEKFQAEQPHPADYWQKFTQEELLEQLSIEAERLKNDFKIQINISAGNLLKALEQGELKTSRQLSSEELKKLAQQQGRHFSEDYFKTRNRLEKEMELPEDQPIVYGTYVDSKGPEGKAGGAPAYGDIFVEVKPKDKFSITEGDSYTSNDSPTGQRKSANLDVGFQNVVTRQLQMEHGHIAKAIYNIEQKITKEYYNINPHPFTYIETQMPNLILDDIEKINIPARHIEKFQQLIKQRVPDFEKWLNKINIIEQ